MTRNATLANDHAKAVKLYAEILQKYPDGSHRCPVLVRIGQEYDKMKKFDEAAKAYVAYGNDAACAKEFGRKRDARTIRQDYMVQAKMKLRPI